MATSFSINGVTVYCLTAGKVLPSWMPDKQRKAIAKDDLEMRHRVELIQDFGFPTAAQTVQQSPDGRYLIATGTYAPRVRIYDTTELSMKCERYMDATPVASCILGDDYSKLAFLQDDRNVELHAAYGKHYRTRIPHFGRCMAYHAPTAELLVGCSGPDVYRLGLEEGRFMTSLPWTAAAAAAVNAASSSSSAAGAASATLTAADFEGGGVNSIAVSRITALTGTAVDGGVVVLWDPRTNAPAGSVAVPLGARGARTNAVSLAFDDSGLGLAVGTGDARALVYDLRRSTPLTVKRHQYDLPVKRVAFHRGEARVVVSADAKVVKMWNRETGAAFANIEPPAPLNDMCIASDKTHVGGEDSGLLFVAGECDRIHAYYMPQLGLAPRWAAFLDTLTEEVDRKTTGMGGDDTGISAVGVTSTSLASASGRGASAGGGGGGVGVYEGFTFVSRDEVASLGLTKLTGTPLLRPYMHGWFMDSRLYDKVRKVTTDKTGASGGGGGDGAADAALAAWRAARIRAKIDEARGSRIAMGADEASTALLPSGAAAVVNKDLALRLKRREVAAVRRAARAADGPASDDDHDDEEDEEGRGGGGGADSDDERIMQRFRSRRAASSAGDDDDDDDDDEDGGGAVAGRSRAKRARTEGRADAGAAPRATAASGAGTLLGDSRFTALFTDSAFAIDEAAEEWRRHHPQYAAASRAGGGARRRAEDGDDVDDGDHDDVDDDDDDEEAGGRRAGASSGGRDWRDAPARGTFGAGSKSRMSAAAAYAVRRSTDGAAAGGGAGGRGGGGRGGGGRGRGGGRGAGASGGAYKGPASSSMSQHAAEGRSFSRGDGGSGGRGRGRGGGRGGGFGGRGGGGRGGGGRGGGGGGGRGGAVSGFKRARA